MRITGIAIVAAGGSKKRSGATLQLQASEQPHPYIMSWTWSPGQVIWANGLSIKELLYLLILLVIYIYNLGPLSLVGPGGRTCRPPPRAGPAHTDTDHPHMGHNYPLKSTVLNTNIGQELPKQSRKDQSGCVQYFRQSYCNKRRSSQHLDIADAKQIQSDLTLLE